MRRVDLSLVVLVLVLAFLGEGIYQMARAYPDADRGMLVFAREQKELFIDSGLVEASYHVRAGDTLARDLRSQTVIVAARTSEHTVFIGAGVIIAAHRGVLTILTARHIVTHGGRRFVVFPQHVVRVALRVVPDRRDDLALVYVRSLPGITYRTAQLAQSSFSSGQSFVVMGHPGAKSWTASPGVAQQHLLHTLLFCPTCDRGDSGAGAFDRAGMLRGIVVARDIIVTPNLRIGSFTQITAFEIVRPEAIRSFLRTAST